MTTAQEILNQQKKSEKQAELLQIQQTLSKALTDAISPLPRATNKMDFAMQIAKNAFNIWQGISLGIKIVRGFRSAFKK